MPTWLLIGTEMFTNKGMALTDWDIFGHGGLAGTLARFTQRTARTLMCPVTHTSTLPASNLAEARP